MLSSLTENGVSYEYTRIGRHNSKKVDVLKSVIPRERNRARNSIGRQHPSYGHDMRTSVCSMQTEDCGLPFPAFPCAFFYHSLCDLNHLKGQMKYALICFSSESLFQLLFMSGDNAFESHSSAQLDLFRS